MPSGIYKRTQFHGNSIKKGLRIFFKTHIKNRFFSKVNKTPTCWIWNGAIRGGQCEYGNMRINNKRKLAHRLSWEIHYGHIPNNKFVLHKCDNPICVNPEHLFLGSWDDNNKDRMNKGRSATGKKHGFYLHPECVPKGEKHFFSKLTNKQIIEIRRKHIPWKYSTYKLAKEYNVTAQTIFCIIKNHTWKHI